MINVDSNSLYRIDLADADQPGTARLDNVSLPLGPSRKVEIRTNRPLNKSRITTVVGNVESLPPASEIVAQEEMNAIRRVQEAREKVEKFHKLTAERVRERNRATKEKQRSELLSKAKRLNAVRVYCVENRIGARLESEEKAAAEPRADLNQGMDAYEIKEVVEDPSREEWVEDEADSAQGLKAFSQRDDPPAEVAAVSKRSFKADFAVFGAREADPPQQIDTQSPKLPARTPPLKSVKFEPDPPAIPRQDLIRSVPVLPKGKLVEERLEKPEPPRKLTRREELELANRLMSKKRSKSEARISTMYESDEPLPIPAAIVVYNTEKALEALNAYTRSLPKDDALLQSQTKATAKLHLTGQHSSLPRKWGQNEFDDLALQIAMVREIASIQEQSAFRQRPKSAEPRVPWGTPIVPPEANRIKRVRIEALTLERGAVAQRKKSPSTPVQAYYKPLTPALDRKPRSPERPRSAGSKDRSRSPQLSPFSLTPRKGATLETIESEFKRKFKNAMRLMKHVPYYERNARMKALREQYETKLAEAKAQYLASLPPKTHGERHLELIRYSAALKALVKDRLKDRYSEDIPAVCTCGALSSKRDPRKPAQCANNCPFYQRQQDYQKAVAEVMHTFNAV